MIGQHIILLPEVDSTNNYAAKCLEDGKLTSGTVILAELQTQGKGQRGNSWHSGRGQFAASIYLDLSFLGLEHWVYFNMASALSVKLAIEQVIPETVLIKWPNDLLFRGKKVAGILIEGQISAADQRGVIVGLGVNLRNTGLIPEAIGLSTVVTVEPTRFLDAWIETFNREFLRLKQGGFDGIKADYLHNLWRLGEEQLAETTKHGQLYGKIVDVNQEGDLVFQTTDNQYTFGIKEIRFTY
jgi:BirA family biotin operon repressor/biotin-[acetyl-CoA-carboxylase] ligase